MRKFKTDRMLILCMLLLAASLAQADWPMAAHDPGRSSWAPEDDMAPARYPRWYKTLTPYIPFHAQVVTVEGTGGEPDLVYVSTAAGVYALDPNDGHEVWFYATPMPVGHSPTVVDGVLYVGCFDKTIHAVDRVTGGKIWQTDTAGAGYSVNPVVVNNKVYAGCRDGYFYCFDAVDGHKLWHFKTDGLISFSAAYSDNTIFFASNDSYAYALNAQTGALVWKSFKILSDGFYAFWPTIAGNRVIFTQSTNFAPHSNTYKITLLQKDAFGPNPTEGELIGAVDANGLIDVQKIIDYYQTKPHHRFMLVLDKATGADMEIAPFLYRGNIGGNREPAAFGPGNLVYASGTWTYSWFLTGRFASWQIGSSKFKPIPTLSSWVDSADEPVSFSLIGNDYLYFAPICDRAGTIVRLSTRQTIGSWGNEETGFEGQFPGYKDHWADFKYGDWQMGAHSNHQNPPVPLKGKVYMHKSNSVLCFGS